VPRAQSDAGAAPAQGGPPVPTALPGETLAAAARTAAPAADRPTTDGTSAPPAPTGQNGPPSSHAPNGQHGQPAPNGQNGQNGAMGNGCTAPQLRRFIKSRPYVPMHELRRRFGIDGSDDDVTQVRLDSGAIYVGLPSREGTLLGELLRGGEIGYELSLDPRSPIVVGVYPMRPVPRG
jgi:hypothetical protein